MKSCLSILLAVAASCGLATFTASAHPGSGIVVDGQGRVYFSEAGDPDAHLSGVLWQIDVEGKLSPLHEGGAHFLTLDVTRGFSQANLAQWFGQRVTPWLQRVDTPGGALIQADGQPVAAHRDGSLYYAKRNLEIVRLSADGNLTPVAPNLATERRGGIKGLA